MIEKDFTDKLGHVLLAIEKSEGQIDLFALLKMDELTDKWTIVISAKWVSNPTFSFQDIFAKVRNEMIQQLGEEAMSTVARIGIFPLDNHLSELMIQRYDSGDTITSDVQINGNLIHEGYVLRVLKKD